MENSGRIRKEDSKVRPRFNYTCRHQPRVDVMTYVAPQGIQVPSKQGLGLGNHPDSLRLKNYMARHSTSMSVGGPH